MTYTHLSPAHQELRDHTEKVATTLPPIAERGTPGTINRPLLAALASHGLLGRLFPTTSAMDLCVIREALARHCTEAETAFALQGLGAYPILLAGRKSTVDAWLPRITSGEAAVGFALTEPGAGSDAAS
ncbi:acyl-CoA dehydrogenase family protein, partial [Actinophytocola sp.]|uniref:acyl-CoA dehydrogenase family protein n=1 Tax=Actinophytocola sp. TaxID=1872138 RepID=UPI00389B0A6C